MMVLTKKTAYEKGLLKLLKIDFKLQKVFVLNTDKKTAQIIYQLKLHRNALNALHLSV